MNEAYAEESRDEFLSFMTSAKESDAVVKIDFVSFSSRIPDDIVIFACEGKADKLIYYYWIQRLRAGLNYENYVCGNKGNTLKLFDALRRDMTGIGARVYYFVDRDFDGLQGRQPNDNIFMTCRYSIENYLVCPEALDDILRIEFHCDGDPAVRREVTEKFSTLYAKFLVETQSLNFRIFLARLIPIRQVGEITGKINAIANVEVHDVVAVGEPANIVPLERDPSPEETQLWREDFGRLEPAMHYRGKFALAFFSRWLELLRKDRQADKPLIFPAMDKVPYAINGNFNLEVLATKAILPTGLREFLAKIP